MVRSELPTEQEVRCPTCNAGWLRDKVITDRFEYEVDGKTQTVVAENVPVRECDNAECQERLSGPEAGRIRHEAICRTFRLLTPREIQAGRERLEMSQERLADSTGIGVATIGRWERGRLLQNRAMDNFLRVFFAFPEVRAVLRGVEQDFNQGAKKEPCTMSLVKNRYRGTPDYIRVLGELVRAAEYRGVTTYQDLAVIMGLPLQGAYMGKETGHVLGEICEDEVNAGRPMLSAVAVSVSGKPGPGFFALAKDLGRFSGGSEEEESFWRQELQGVYETWKRALHKPSSNAKHDAVAD
jgi:putative zinc finger/helix-turn-helix YgiT family protein